MKSTLRTLALSLLAFTVYTLPQITHAATATITPETLLTDSSRPTLRGTSDDIRSLKIEIRNDDDRKVWTSRTVRVRDDAWYTRVTKSLKPGAYEVSVINYGVSKKPVVATSTLTVSDPDARGTVSVSMVPLFLNATAPAGQSAPVAYVQVRNTGKEAVALSGFDLVQNGTASDASVTGFATSDNLGGSRTFVGGQGAYFSGKKAFVPLVATIPAGEMRIYTLKAQVGTNPAMDLGKTLQIAVTGVRGNLTATGMFPLAGTTLTVTR